MTTKILNLAKWGRFTGLWNLKLTLSNYKSDNNLEMQVKKEGDFFK
jgi:hypothetical protein